MASVKVVVRVRPFNERELNMDSKCVIKMEDKKTIIYNQKVFDNSTFVADGGSNIREKCKTFTYDHSYWSVDNKDSHFASQEQVFQDLGKGVIDCAFEGYNACVFAYGQTGSGKSFSMMGQTGTKNEGLIPRICKGLFEKIKTDSHREYNFRTEVSYLEIYNEKVRDLLRVTSKHNLKVREHPNEGPYVEDLSKHIVVNYDDIEELMNRGNENRTIAATSMNDVSSRSHAIFTIKFVQAKMIGNMPSETVSKIHLVDLAGSERADSTGAVGIRLKEGGNINKSLLTLINVISTLADISLEENRNRKFYIPYRDSVLTWLLKDSLGGNSKTVMVATISPACINYAETLNTLRYANRAKSIINKPTINEDQNVKLIRELRSEIERLKAMIKNDETNDDQSEMKLNNANQEVTQLTNNWKCKWKEYHELFDEDDHCLELIRREKRSLTILSKQQPYLIGVDDYILSNSGLNFYLLNTGKTLMGTENADIILQEQHEEDEELVGKEHCYLVNNNFNVILYPLNDSKCYVNGRLVDKATQLETGSFIMIGKRNLFRFNNPFEINNLIQSGVLRKQSLFFEAIKLKSEKETVENNENLIENLKNKINEEKIFFLNQLNEYEEKFVEQKKRIEQLCLQNEWANNEIKVLNGDLKLKLSEFKEKNEVFEREKIEYLVEKEQFEEQKLLLDCLKDLNEKQLLQLRTQLCELRDVKTADYQLISQIKKDKFLIEKEINELHENRFNYLEKLGDRRGEVINNKDLKETKLKIIEQSKIENEILKKKDELLEFIEIEKQEFETLSQFLNNKKLNFLSENKTLEDAIEVENETIERAREQLMNLKSEKENLYSLIELEIQNTRVNMDKELIEDKTRKQNEKANLIKQENKMLKILEEKLYENNDEKELIEKELKSIILEQNQIDEEINKLKQKENLIKETIITEYEGLNELKQRDLDELKGEEERIKNLCDNSLQSLEKLFESKSSDIKSNNLKLAQLDSELSENISISNELMSRLSIYESKRMNEERQLFDSEVDFNSKFKSKLQELDAQILNIEKNHQLKLDENFSIKEKIKAKVCLIVGEKKGIRLFYADLNDKLREIEQKYASMRAQLNYSSNFDFNNNNKKLSNKISNRKISKKDAEKIFLTHLNNNERQQQNASDDFNSSLSLSYTDNKIPMLRLKSNRNSSFTSDLSSSSDNFSPHNNQKKEQGEENAEEENFDSKDNMSSLNSLTHLSDLNYFDLNESKPSVIKPSAIYRHGIEVDIIKHVLVSKSKLDEHNEFLIKIGVKNETWTIYRRYNKFRELHNTCKTEKFLAERKLQLEHYLRCFLELLINEPKCPISVSLSNNSQLSKDILCKFCPFFQPTDDDLSMSKKESIIKFNAQNSNSLIYQYS